MPVFSSSCLLNGVEVLDLAVCLGEEIKSSSTLSAPGCNMQSFFSSNFIECSKCLGVISIKEIEDKEIQARLKESFEI